MRDTFPGIKTFSPPKPWWPNGAALAERLFGSRRTPSVTIQAALLLGFGLAVGLWFFAGYQLTQRSTELQSETSKITSRYMRAQETLATVRTQVLLSSVYVRDALLDPDHEADDSYRDRFEASYLLCARALNSYLPVLNSSDEQTRIADLRREIDDFHVQMLDVLATDVKQWPRDARVLLQQRVGPKRDVVVRVSDQIQALNRAAFVEHRAETSELNGMAQRWAWERLGLALASTVVIGLLATLYASGLAKRLRVRQEHDRKTADELQRLSARLLSAQEDERRTMARELHDEVGQTLTAVKMELTLAAKASTSQPAIGAHVGQARQMLEDTVRAVRDLSHLLHPALLDDMGLVAAVKHQLDGFSRRHNVRCDLFDTQMENRLAPELETTVYRIIQEALSNVAKHAHASRCRISLRGGEASVLLTIEDDGSGFDTASLDQRPPGIGLIGVRERVALFGGTFRLITAAGQGTRLEIELPARPYPAPAFENDESAMERHSEQGSPVSR
jgi:signal transduction histidine kinase